MSSSRLGSLREWEYGKITEITLWKTWLRIMIHKEGSTVEIAPPVEAMKIKVITLIWLMGTMKIKKKIALKMPKLLGME